MITTESLIPADIEQVALALHFDLLAGLKYLSNYWRLVTSEIRPLIPRWSVQRTPKDESTIWSLSTHAENLTQVDEDNVASDTHGRQRLKKKKSGTITRRGFDQTSISKIIQASKQVKWDLKGTITSPKNLLENMKLHLSWWHIYDVFVLPLLIAVQADSTCLAHIFI